MPEPSASAFERALQPLHRWVWRDARRRARKLITFASTEASGARDLARAAELTPDPLLRQLYLRHSLDEHHHAHLFQARGLEILAATGHAREASFEANWLAPGERGLDQVRIDGGDAPLLAFLHLSERAAAARFAAYRDVIDDPETRETFRRVLVDEVFHMLYTRSQLERIVPVHHRGHLWRARAARLWKAYLGVAMAIAGLLGTVVLLVQYFTIVPIFAIFAKRAARRERSGWSETIRRDGPSALESQY